MNDHSAIPMGQSELLINECIFQGQDKPNAKNLIDLTETLNTYKTCKELLDDDFFESQQLFEAENKDKCRTQENNVRAFVDRKILNLTERISKFNQEGKVSMIPAIQGQINKMEDYLNFNLKRINKKKNCDSISKVLASGLIFIED